jgi:hypothetical protein
MATVALSNYAGASVALVGEWLGDSGTPELEGQLYAHWTLVDSVPLPNWTDTAHNLTIWQRRTKTVPALAPPWPACSASGVSHDSLFVLRRV